MRFPARPPAFDLTKSPPDALSRIVAHATSPTLPDGRYLHWSDLRYRPPPDGLTSPEWWFALKIARLSARVPVPAFLDVDGQTFSYCRLNTIDRATHELDRRDATREMLHAMGDDAARQRYRIDQLIEEAINSSLIEGAKLTTRAQAKQLLRDRAEPRTHGERMVVNNYRAMERLLELVERDLTLADLLEIHAILGDGALDAEDCAGRVRRPDENVRVEDAVTGEVWFVPPAAETLAARLEGMLKFANDPNPEPFVHPLLRAMILHFWLAYLHPFVDGNGRLARALFYWQMLRSRYDFAQYLSISGPIDRARRAYYLAFAHAETDGADLTYFILHQFGVLRRATDELLDHLKGRSERLSFLHESLANAIDLNDRQQAVLAYLVRNPHVSVTVTGHSNSHQVAYLTARKDLQDLEALGYLRRVRQGRTDRYLVTEKVAQQFMSQQGA